VLRIAQAAAANWEEAIRFEANAGKAERDKLSVYFNFDNGTPPITGFYLEGNEEMKPIMEAWLKPSTIWVRVCRH